MYIGKITHEHFVWTGAAGLGNPDFLSETCILNKANQWY